MSLIIVFNTCLIGLDFSSGKSRNYFANFLTFC